MVIGVLPLSALAGELVEVEIECEKCGNIVSRPTWEGREDDCREWMLEHQFSTCCHACAECYDEWHCSQCHACFSEEDWFCPECYLCASCVIDNEFENHCSGCSNHCEDFCECSHHLCEECHYDHDAFCQICGECLYIKYDAGEMCPHFDGSDNDYYHCRSHCLICTICQDCFTTSPAEYCEDCDHCASCILEAGLHCTVCGVCLNSGSEVPECEKGAEENGGAICRECCIDAGMHCESCGRHVPEDEWCETGGSGSHCTEGECATETCESCGICLECAGIDLCDTCGFCEECCLEASSAAGCCCGLCVETDEFQAEDHLCPGCGSAFSCENDFCDDCGCCMDCCTERAEEMGCFCGICVESQEFEEHLCEQCGEPVCAHGYFCEECGYCMECCLEESELEGCMCGLCVESDEFRSSAHICGCGNLSCVVPFCTKCGQCRNCCTCVGPELELKEPETGTILKQPADTRVLQLINVNDRCRNKIEFHAEAVNGEGLRYQWYQIKDNGAATALEDQIYENSNGKDHLRLEFITGTQTPDLSIAVPNDACCHTYEYYCVIKDTGGRTLSTTRTSTLNVTHNYQYKEVAGTGMHILHCVGAGCTKTKGSMYEHIAGPERTIRYATKNYEGIRSVRCTVCSATLSSRTIPSLGDHPFHTYEYEPLITVKRGGGTSCMYHINVCACGERLGSCELHDWNDWTVIKEPTDRETGSKERFCLLCGWVETMEIPKQTHRHQYDFDDWSNMKARDAIRANSMYHWQECLSDECNATAGKEPHVWGRWSTAMQSGPKQKGGIYRFCEVCGWQQDYTVREGAYIMKAENSSTPIQSAEIGCKVTLKADPPKGYEFVRWVNDSEENFDIPVIRENSTDEKITFRVPRDQNPVYDKIWYDKDGKEQQAIEYYAHSIDIVAECRRIDNTITMRGAQGDVTLKPGEKLMPDGSVLWKEAYAPDYVAWYYRQTEDDHGKRTAYLILRDYKGGAIEVSDTGLSCDLVVRVDGDSEISVSGEDVSGILGCPSGGDITVTAASRAKLLINVVSTGGSCYGIRPQKDANWKSDELYVTDALDLTVRASVRGNGDVTAYGLYSSSFVTVDGISTRVDITGSVAGSNTAAVPFQGIHASKEIHIIDCDKISVDGRSIGVDRKAVALYAKKTFHTKGELEAIYPAGNSRLANGTLIYDKYEFVQHETVNEDWSRRAGYDVIDCGLFSGYRLSFDERSFEGCGISVEGLFQDAQGNWLVPASDNRFEYVDAVFYVTLPSGRIGPTLYAEGENDHKIVDSFSYDNRGTYAYAVDMNEDTEIRLTSCGDFRRPGAPASSVQLSGEPVHLGWYMDNISLVYLRDSSRIQDAGSVNAVLLERLDADEGWVQVKQYEPASAMNVFYSEKPEYSEIGSETRYRISVLYEKTLYSSDEFTITWTADRDAVSKDVCDEVEIYVDKAMLAKLHPAISQDGGVWVTLDHRENTLVYLPGEDAVTACEWCRFDKNTMIVLARFESEDGSLGLYGDTIRWNGRYYDFSGIIKAIRTGDDSYGDLKIVLLGDMTIRNDYDRYGYIDEFLIGRYEHDAESAIITNNTGSITVYSPTTHKLSLRNEAAEGYVYSGSDVDGVAISAIRASRDIELTGKTDIRYIGVAWGTRRILPAREGSSSKPAGMLRSQTE